MPLIHIINPNTDSRRLNLVIQKEITKGNKGKFGQYKEYFARGTTNKHNLSFIG